MNTKLSVATVDCFFQGQTVLFHVQKKGYLIRCFGFKVQKLQQ